jgi:hypothetical protein
LRGGLPPFLDVDLVQTGPFRGHSDLNRRQIAVPERIVRRTANSDVRAIRTSDLYNLVSQKEMLKHAHLGRFDPKQWNVLRRAPVPRFDDAQSLAQAERNGVANAPRRYGGVKPQRGGVTNTLTRKLVLHTDGSRRTSAPSRSASTSCNRRLVGTRPRSGHLSSRRRPTSKGAGQGRGGRERTQSCRARRREGEGRPTPRRRGARRPTSRPHRPAPGGAVSTEAPPRQKRAVVDTGWAPRLQITRWPFFHGPQPEVGAKRRHSRRRPRKSLSAFARSAAVS